ncbi:MAG: prepilin-type N-terminal cleavage/methylation domain-containing protein [bacterium]|nr:prepilin-type N-terminal cleavage/methylation domain-containing protein [bacterium]
MKHEARSTKSETNFKKNKFQTGSGVLNFGILNFDIVSNFGFRISNFQKRKALGFTLLETVVALAILTAAIVGPMSLVSRGIAGARTSKNRVIGSYLAQEGMEVVRGIKENNALAGKTANAGVCNDSDQWDFGLCPGSGPLAWRANILNLTLEPGGDSPVLLDYDSSSGNPGLYNYQSGNQTIFTRTVEIFVPSGPEVDAESGFSIPPEDILDVVITVFWREGLSTREVELVERFYNWQ